MPKLIVNTSAPDFLYWPDAFANDGPADILSTSASALKFTSNAGYVITLTGTGFTLSGGTATAGTIAAVTVRNAAESVVFMTIGGLATPFADLYPVLFGTGTAAPDPVAAFELMLAGKDALIGSDDSDRLGGYSPGNDTVDAGDGNDGVSGDPGDDRLDGGHARDYDVVSYLNPSAVRGIVLDAEKGTVTDAWGDKDRIRAFEVFEGSRFGDVIKGTNGTHFAESYYGNDGADIIDGRGGYDRVYYVDEADSGGLAGISADLSKGRVTDGFGRTDRIKNIEGIAGTQNADRFVGNGKANEFLGLGGVDRFDGGDGDDWLAFWLNDSFGGHGVNVDLRDKGGQVIDDGFGNAEVARSIEKILGSDFADVVVGDKKSNSIDALGGNDRLDGGSGDDWIDAGSGDDTVQGGSGDDELDGGEGQDTLSYQTAKSAITVNLSGGKKRQETGDGFDRIKGFENLVGSRFDDHLVGNNGSNVIDGRDGDDTIDCVWGYDQVFGGAGDDRIYANDSDSALLDGGQGRDTLAFRKGLLESLDLTDAAVAVRLNDFEIIDISSDNDTVLYINRASVMTEGVERVEGDAGSVVVAVGERWVPLGTTSDAEGTLYRYGFAGQEIKVRKGVGFAVELSSATLSPLDGFILKGDAISMSPAGDINGDGFEDFLFGNPNPVGDDEIRIIFGGNLALATDQLGRSVLDPSFLSPDQGFVIRGAPPFDEAGWSVSLGGDINGDGLDDLIVGAPRGDDGGSRAGDAYIVFGSSSGFGEDVGGERVVDLSTLQADVGFVVQGAIFDSLGYSVSDAGDVNGDGFGDVIIGAPSVDSLQSIGEAYVVFGGANGFGVATNGRQVVDLTDLSPDVGFVIRGGVNDRSGYAVSSAGDVNSDGLDDMIVSAPGAGNNGLEQVYVLFGSLSAFGVEENGRRVVDVAAIGPNDGFFIRLEPTDNGVAATVGEVASAGDVNGDGFDDVLISVPGYTGPSGYIEYQVGKVYVVFGSSAGFGSVTGGRRILDLDDLSPSSGFAMVGTSQLQTLGLMLGGAGDVNGDGFDDLIVGGHGDQFERQAYIVFGSATGAGTVVDGQKVLELSHLSVDQGFALVTSDDVGSVATSAGDLNGDGFDDVAIAGIDTTIIYGGAFGGSLAPVAKTGTTAAEKLIGGRGADALNGGGGVDVFRGGAGADTISTPDLAFRSIDGGSGTDTLAFTGNAQTIDFTLLADNKVKGIEAFDISGTGADTLVIGALDVFHFSDTPNTTFTGAASHNSLVVRGDAGDTVSLEGFDPDGGGPSAPYVWQLVAADRKLDGSAGGAYDLYQLVRDSAVLASVAVDADIAVLL